MENIELAKKLKVARIQKGYSLHQLAKITGVSITTLSTAERGVRKPCGRVLHQIAIACDIPLTEIVDIKLAEKKRS